MLLVKLNHWQIQVASDNHRFKIICAGRRSGKSVLARMIVLQWATKNVGNYWIVSPNYRQAKTIHWNELRREIPQKWIAKKNEVELSITLTNGSVITLKGSENPDSLRGIKLRGLVIDEIASIRNWSWLWQEVLRPTLTDYEAPAIFISTPKGFNHFYDLFQMGQVSDESYKSWKFTSFDNPFIPKGEIEKARNELTEDTFAQEYLADFRKHTGLIYKDFDRDYHVIPPFEIPENWEIYCGIDWGDVHPFACLWVATDNEYNFWVVDELYGPNLRLDEVAGMYNSNKYRSKVVSAWCDPSRPDWIKEMEWRKVWLTPANKSVSQQLQSWVTFGIEKVSEMLKPTFGHSILSAPPNIFTDEKKWSKGLPRLFVFNTCQNLIREFESYKWKTNRQESEMMPVPDKINDDALDALRYMMVSYKKPVTYKPSVNDIGNANWSLDNNTRSPGDATEVDWSIT